MAVYAIGDIQGCFEEFQGLLSRIGFDRQRDQLWLTGDLVNRGPDSLAVLRFVRALGESVRCVLGNHDLHLLAIASGARSPRKQDTLDPVLAAADADELLDWLRHRPLLHHDEGVGWTMVHAGLPPQWDIATAAKCARQLEAQLQNPGYAALLQSLFGDQPDRWRSDLAGIDLLRFTTNCLTRLRYCHRDGRLALNCAGPPGTQPRGLLPWFEIPGRRSADTRLVFGHWSTLGPVAQQRLLALDGGCVWGGELVAARLDGDPQLIREPCAAHCHPGR